MSVLVSEFQLLLTILVSFSQVLLAVQFAFLPSYRLVLDSDAYPPAPKLSSLLSVWPCLLPSGECLKRGVKCLRMCGYMRGGYAGMGIGKSNY